MIIDPDILFTYGASTKKYDKGISIFNESDVPHYFYQILEGSVKVFSMNNDGKELIQGMFKVGESFGEPPLFIDKPYPSTAVAIENSVIIKLSKEKLMTILIDNPEISKSLIVSFASRLYDKSSILQILLFHTPEERLIAFLNKVKIDLNTKSTMLIPYTRQQIADCVGLRVETVIRALSKLNEENKVSIVKHKLYY